MQDPVKNGPDPQQWCHPAEKLYLLRTGSDTVPVCRGIPVAQATYLDQSDDELGVEHEHGLVLPGRLAVEVHAVQYILHHSVRHYRHQYGVLKPEHQLKTIRKILKIHAVP
jgi:hypothetical protein